MLMTYDFGTRFRFGSRHWAAERSFRTDACANFLVVSFTILSTLRHEIILLRWNSEHSRMCVYRSSMAQSILPCDFDESDAAPEFSIVIGGEFSRTHDISPADICKG